MQHRMQQAFAICFGIVTLLAVPCAGHPCEAEVASACPDRPGDEVAKCLKKPAEHETETTLTSECTDFIALNTACKEDIGKFCDDAFFSDDTTLCLTQWTDAESISGKCASVIEWAVPKAEEEEGEEGPTDELGLSEADYEEKKEWQKKRKAARGDAIERMKMKDVDKKKEEDRVALESFKKENAEEYERMIQQQEEDKRQAAEFKRQERMRAAALDRKKKAENGDSEEEQPKVEKKASTKKKSKGSWFSTIFATLVIGGIGYGIYFFATQSGSGKRGGAGSGKKKGKRG